MTNKMKTSVNMIRPMGKFNVIQRTKDGMFNATQLLKQWNKNPLNPKRNLKDFFKTKSCKEFLKVLAEDEEFLKGVNLPYLKNRGKYGGTWMHPYLFIKFSFWINPKFELEVIKFVYDQLINNRHSAGVNFNNLTNSVKKFKKVDYRTIAKGLNWIVFGVHEKDIRNKATESQLKELVEVQNKLSFAVDMNYIKNFDDLLKEMRKMYHSKHTYKITI